MVHFSLILLAVCAFVDALVAVPERRPVSSFLAPETSAATPNDRLFLKFGPLIGGPSWLPLHVKVILENGNGRIEHRWDFVPQNATEISTLLRLLSLRAVPGDIRYQAAPIRRKQQNDNRIDLPVGFDIVPLTEDDDDSLAETNIALVEAQRAATEALIQKAAVFCQSYPDELHLIKNNCWMFASRLYDHLFADHQTDLDKTKTFAKSLDVADDEGTRI